MRGPYFGGGGCLYTQKGGKKERAAKEERTRARGVYRDEVGAMIYRILRSLLFFFFNALGIDG